MTPALILAAALACAPPADYSPTPVVAWDDLPGVLGYAVIAIEAGGFAPQAVDLQCRDVPYGETAVRQCPGVGGGIPLQRYFSFYEAELVRVDVFAFNEDGCSEEAATLNICWPALWRVTEEPYPVEPPETEPATCPIVTPPATTTATQRAGRMIGSDLAVPCDTTYTVVDLSRAFGGVGVYRPVVYVNGTLAWTGGPVSIEVHAGDVLRIGGCSIYGTEEYAYTIAPGTMRRWEGIDCDDLPGTWYDEGEGRDYLLDLEVR